MVYRFSEGDEGLYPDANGAWVEYEDYERLQSAVTARLTDIRARYSMGVDEAFKCQYLRDLESIIK